MKRLIMLLLGICLPLAFAEPTAQAATGWETLKDHPAPQWFEGAKFGIFIHWGPYSVIGHIKGNKGYAEWIPCRIYQDPEYYFPYLQKRFGGQPPEFGYKDMIAHFKAEKWDPDAWAQLFHQAGAKYVVLTAEHHDGYALWDSELTPWAATKIGPMRDLVGDLGVAVRKRGLKYAPSYHRERHTSYFAQKMYLQKSPPPPAIAAEIERMPQAADLYGPFEINQAFIEDYVARWKEIEKKYQPDLMWIDHVPFFHQTWCPDFASPAIKDYRAACRTMIAEYFKAAEGWGKEVWVNNKGPQHGHNWPAGVGFMEADNMKVFDISIKWQNPATLGTSYGYMKWEDENDAYKSSTELVHLLCDVVSKNGNLLLNIGPRADGTIPDGMQQRLLAMGRWLKTNGEAIYGTRPWLVSSQPQPEMRFTTKGDLLFAILLQKPDGPLMIHNPQDGALIQATAVSLLGSPEKLNWRLVEGGLEIEPPARLPGEHAWVFQIQTKSQ